MCIRDSVNSNNFWNLPGVRSLVEGWAFYDHTSLPGTEGLLFTARENDGRFFQLAYPHGNLSTCFYRTWRGSTVGSFVQSGGTLTGTGVPANTLGSNGQPDKR